MRTIIATTLTSFAIALAAAPLAAVADSPDDGPVADAMATQSPEAYNGFAFKPCATRRSVNCYWDAIGRTGEYGHSYFAIRVGKQVCIRYWDPSYNRKHGHCKALPKH